MTSRSPTSNLHSIPCDVLVAGGGPAGIAAAVAAARGGAQVVLLERYGFLGGLATAGLVGTVCGLYLRDAAAPRPTLVSGGFPREFSERLARASHTESLRLADGLWVLPYDPWAFERLADALIGENPNITPILHATLTGAEVEGGRVARVRALAWGEALTIQSGCVVDGTGEATAAALASAPTERGLADQAPALVFIMENVDPGFAERGMLDVLRALRRAVQDGRLPAGCERLALVPGTGWGGRVAFKLNLAPADPGLPDWRQITAWERDGRGRVDEIQLFLSANVISFRHARFSRAAPQLGARAGRRIRGRATLGEADVLASRKREDGIARGGWPIERWSDAPRPLMTFFPENDYYEIPADCLRPEGLENVFVAGRCLAAEPGALASARVIGTALATGWAAGSLAAAQAAGQSEDEAICAIRHQMEEDSNVK